MSKLLEEVFSKLAELPEVDQDSIAVWLLEELKSEESWEKAFSESQDSLAKLADQALSEHGRGRAKKLDPDKL